MTNNGTPKSALITGGSRGIGLGCARRLAAGGFNLVINGMRPEEQVAETLDELRAHGVEGDIGSAESRRRILDRARDAFGGLHVLVNNAGVAPKERRDLLEASEESFEYVVGTNLQGPYFLTQAAANWMVEQKRERPADFHCIINVGSISATVASVNRGEYCIAKAGMAMMTSLFAARLGEFDIPVYEVRPGVTKTDMTSGVTGKYDKLIEQGLCITPRWGLPADVGMAVGALAEGALPYSTGQVIMVDGGLTVQRL